MDNLYWYFRCFIGVAGCFLILFSGTQVLYGQSLTDSIRVNQVGYYPENQKTAAVIGSGLDSFEVRTADLSSTVYSGALNSTGNWGASGEDVMIADFSSVRSSGEYVVVVPGLGRSHSFAINDTVLDSASFEAARYFYYNRASTGLDQQHAGDYERPLGHPDDSVQVHSSANSSESSPVESSGGWYDAGDYGKYLMTAGISTYTLLSLYEQFPDYTSGMAMNIPESSNNIPDLLDECLYELRWMLTMQDTADGGVYHKLTAMDFSGQVMPHEDSATRYVCGKNTNVTLDFAATMAAAHRIFQDYEQELPGFADSCLAAARQAWTWAQNNPNADAAQCPDFQTGSYGDNDQSDEFIWAAAELYLATGDESYYNAEPIASGSIGAPSWPNKKALAVVSLLNNADSLSGNAAADLPTLESMLQNLADGYTDYRNNNSPYRIVMGQSGGDWVWGSNGMAGNQAFMLLTAYNYFNDREYFNAAFSNVNYLLGENATGYCFLTGFGEQSPMNPHHRTSAADTVEEPVPGMIVGGPQGGQQDDCNYPSNLDARSYLDEWCSYSTNEVTINWNAPFVFAATGLHAVMQRTCKAPDLGDTISLCAEGTPVTLDAGTPDEGNYIWYKNGAVLTEDSASTYTIDSSMQTLEGSYSLLRDSAGCRHRDTVEVVPGTSYDTDGDGTSDCSDGCLYDANKTSPGDCGCGTPDTDSDGDGVPDCNDACPEDTNKTAPGECGCGIADTDSDGDGTLDCNDECPDDGNKTQPGECGCGMADVDSDGDGVLDCNDQCPDDADKTQPGTCGCGIADVDTDGDGTLDCNDECPNDANKTQPGECGCGNTETSCEDCAGVPNGEAFIDSCGVCSGGTTDREPVTNPEECTVTVVNNNHVKEAINIYPNPVSNRLYIELPENKSGQAVLMDMQSRVVLDQKITGSAELNMKAYSQGMYLLEIRIEGKGYQYKVSKQ